MAKSKKKKEMSDTMPVSDDKWKAESDARTVMDACEIMADKGRMKAAREYLDKKKRAFETLDEVRAYAKEEHGSLKEED